VELLVARGALDPALDAPAAGEVAPRRDTSSGPAVGVVVEPDRAHVAREMLGAAAELAEALDGHVVAFGFEPADDRFGSWGADAAVVVEGAHAAEDAAGAIAAWAEETGAWAVLAPSTAWGREVASRAAARLGAGLTGDAVALEVDGGRLVAWKPAFGGQLVAAILASSPVQTATVRVGVLPSLVARPGAAVPVDTRVVTPRGRVRVLASGRDDDLDLIAEAPVVVGVGAGVDPADYPLLDPLVGALGAELGATRKVTDQGWLPRSRQIGITGRTISPRLFVSIGASGKFNHMVGVRAAHTVLAVNPDRGAPVFAATDVGIVAEWHTVLPLLVAELDRIGVTSSATSPVL
jgi:electron transfer flavoprotein alpha subunit